MNTRSRIAIATLAVVLVGAAAVANGIPVTHPAALIAFSCNGDICVMHDDGSGLVQLTRDKWIDSYPAWSPDGRTLAFTGCLGKSVVYTMKADGSDRRRLTARGADEAFPAWSPDGTELAFDDNASGTIVVADATGVQRHQVTYRPSASPTWSPNGTELAFIASNGRSLALTHGDLDVTSAAGTNGRRIARDAAFPAWSPTGAEIAFARATRGTDSEIWVVAADGSRSRRVVAHSAQGGGVSWSPDGSRLAYVWDSDIYTIGLDGRHPERLTHGGDNLAPAWQPT
jgi:Tol biopolymer transport system component